MGYLSHHQRRFFTFLCVVFISIFASACNQFGANNFAPADFERLRWIEGSWRGSDASGQNHFFERYRFAGDIKIETESFSDAALTKVDSQSATYLENGTIYHRNRAMLWAATKIDDTTIEFAPKEKAANSFTWKKESADVWTVRMTNKDANGSVKETVYRMERIK